jgi:hypothetical protein
MKYSPFRTPPASGTVSLDAHAEQAGLALACAYSSSAELDAELIAAKRAAGVYGPRRQRRQILAAAAGVASGLAMLLLVIGLFG